MSPENGVYIVLNQTNDPDSVARRYISRRIAKGLKENDIVSEAWRKRDIPPPNAITSESFSPLGPPSHGIRYDPTVVDGATEEEVIEALRVAGGCNRFARL